MLLWINVLRRATTSPLWILVNRPTTCVIIWPWSVAPIRCSQTTRSPAYTRPAWACHERSTTPPRLRSSPQPPPAKRSSMMTAPRKPWPNLRATEPDPPLPHHQHDEDDQRDRPRRRTFANVHEDPSTPVGKPPTCITLVNHSSRRPRPRPSTPAARHQTPKSSSSTAAERWSKNPAANKWCNAAACAHGRLRPDGYGVL